MFEIQSGIPIPAGNARERASQKYNWDKMKVGDSIFIPESEVPAGKELKDLRQQVYNAARGYGSTKGKKFVALVVQEPRANPDYDKPRDAENPGEDVPATIQVKGVRCWLESVEEPKPPIEAVAGKAADDR